jgi:hypothetical protein
MLIGEELELLKWGFTRCYYVAFYCSHCGCGRLMAALPPDDEYVDCPACARSFNVDRVYVDDEIRKPKGKPRRQLLVGSG